MPKRPIFAVLVAALVVLVMAPTAFAAEPAVEPPESTLTVVPTLLPGLIVVVDTDTNGYLTSVDLHDVADPATGEPVIDPGTGEAAAAVGYVATKVDNRRVRFENSETGTRVEVKAKEHKLETKVRTGALADLLGTHTWAGTVLGEETTVVFTVGEENGTPTLTDVAVTAAAAAGSALSWTISEPETEIETDEIETEVKIRFTNALAQRADLKLEVEVHTTADDEHDAGRASLKVALKVKDEKMRVAAADLASLPQSWSGALCDGTPVSVSWNNNADGTIGDVSAPEAIEVEMHGHEVKVRFADHAELKLKLKLKDDDTMELKVDPKIKCERGSDPDVNTPVEEHGRDKKHDERSGEDT